VNDYLTYCAQAKILRLIELSGAQGIRLVCDSLGISIELLFNPPLKSDIILTVTPRVYTDVYTLRQLQTASIDYSYQTDDFIFTKAKRELPANAI
jgi:hypothetical protein